MGATRTRITITGGAAALAAALLLSGCTSGDARPAAAGGSAAARPSAPTATPSTGTPSPDAEPLSAFEQQLPVRGEFVDQGAETSGSVVVERRAPTAARRSTP